MDGPSLAECLRALICLIVGIMRRRRSAEADVRSARSPMALRQLSMNRPQALDWHAECHVWRP